MAESMRTSQKVVFILNHHEDVDEYQKIANSIGGVHVIVAATPDICWELEKREISYLGIEKFYDLKGLYPLGMRNYDIIENLCSEIDPAFQKTIPLLKKYGFKPAMDNFRYLKILLDGLSLRIHIIQSIIEKEKPDEIITFTSDLEFQISNMNPFPFDSGENLYSLVLKCDGWGHQFRHRDIKKHVFIDKSLNKQERFWVRFLRILKHYPVIYIPLLIGKRDGIINGLKIIFFQIRDIFLGARALFLIDGPSWSSMIFDLYRSGYYVVYLLETHEVISTEHFIDKKVNENLMSVIRPICHYGNIDFSHIFIERSNTVFKAYLGLIHNVIENLEKGCIKYHPVALLTGEKAAFIEHIYAHISHSHNVPVIGWQFGDSPSYAPLMLYNDLMNSNIYLSYGPGIQKMLREAPHNHFDCRIESVGSLILEQLYMKNISKNSQKKIVYVTTAYQYYQLHVSDFHIHDNVLWSYQKQILKILGNSQIPTTFKLFPSRAKRPLFFEFIKDNHYDNITIIQHERTFMDLLKDTDIVICDYTSTPLIEAIAAHKIVFVLLSSPLLREEALVLLKKRVYLSTDIEEFINMISDYLNGKPVNQNPDIENTEYLEMFGVHKLDGCVAQRALAIMNKEINLCS